MSEAQRNTAIFYAGLCILCVLSVIGALTHGETETAIGFISFVVIQGLVIAFFWEELGDD